MGADGVTAHGSHGKAKPSGAVRHGAQSSDLRAARVASLQLHDSLERAC